MILDSRKAAVFAGLALATLATSPVGATYDDPCRPRHPRPKIVARTMGPCAFDLSTLSFAGDAAQQAACLMRPVGRLAKLGPPEKLPDPLAQRVGRASDLPARETVSAYLSKLDLEADFAAYLWRPVSRARDDDPDAPLARYLVIHDTSGPYLGRRAWPENIDTDRKINNLAGHRCSDGWERVHVVVNRSGAMLLGHDFAQPWRATKFERAVEFDGALKGLFLHVEFVQPRRRDARRGRRNDLVAPIPGFTAVQYDRLALLYVVASVRAGAWLIPAFHAVIDNEVRGGHDDPQNFEVAAFGRSLAKVMDRIDNPDRPEVSAAP